MPVHRQRLTAKARAEAHRALSASKRAESGYVLAVQGIMRRTHASVLQHVRRLDVAVHDADGDDSDARFLRRLFVFQKADVQRAFDGMAATVKKSSAKGAAIVGIRAADVPGLDAVIAAARERNVRLIRNASADFLQQVRAVLDEYGSLHPGSGAGPERLATLLKAPAPGDEPEEPRDLTEALQARVGVSRSRAVTIARDQTLKLNGAVTRHRQQAVGVQRFTWSSVGDERVRDAHRALNGRVFSWDEGLPPDVADEVDEEPGAIPSSPVNCRCVGLPVLQELEEPEAASEAEEPDFAAAAEE